MKINIGSATLSMEDLTSVLDAVLIRSIKGAGLPIDKLTIKSLLLL